MNRAVTDGALLLAVDLSMRAEIPSGPEDLDVSKDDNKLEISSVVQRNGYSDTNGNTGTSITIVVTITTGPSVVRHHILRLEPCMTS